MHGSASEQGFQEMNLTCHLFVIVFYRPRIPAVFITPSFIGLQKNVYQNERLPPFMTLVLM